MSTLIYIIGAIGFISLVVALLIIAACIAGADADRAIERMLGQASSGDRVAVRVMSTSDDLAPAERRRP